MTDFVLTLPEAGNPRTEWCPMSRALDVVASRSAFLVLREAFYGTTRFDDFASRAGISEQIAAARLKSLVDEGLLERRPYQEPGQRTRYEYHLTEAGGEFFPVIAAMMRWSSRWRGPAPITFRHHGCGATVRTTLRCETGHDDLTAADIELVPTESARARARSRAASSQDRGRATE
jgi:DNA-binding HxlR family transcriptional regulator